MWRWLGPAPPGLKRGQSLPHRSAARVAMAYAAPPGLQLRTERVVVCRYLVALAGVPVIWIATISNVVIEPSYLRGNDCCRATWIETGFAPFFTQMIFVALAAASFPGLKPGGSTPDRSAQPRGAGCCLAPWIATTHDCIVNARQQRGTGSCLVTRIVTNNQTVVSINVTVMLVAASSPELQPERHRQNQEGVMWCFFTTCPVVRA
jgi:hypothetical protein